MKKILWLFLLFNFFVKIYYAETPVFGEVPRTIYEYHEFYDSITFDSTVQFQAPVTFNGAVIDSSSITIQGIATFNSTAIFNLDLIDSSSLRVQGIATFNSTVVLNAPVIDSSSLTVYGIATFNSTTILNAPVIDSSSLTVKGTAVFDSNVTLNAPVIDSSSLQVEGATIFNSTVVLNAPVIDSSSLQVQGESIFNSTVVLNAPVIDSSSLVVHGAFTANSTSVFNGAVTDSSSLRVIGAITFDSSIISGSTQWNSGNNIDANVLTLTDSTLNDADTTRHGWLKKLDGDTTHFMRGDAEWSVPVGTAPHYAVSPLSISNDTISISLSDSATNGYLSSADWQRFDTAYLFRFESASGTLPLTLTLSTNSLLGSITQVNDTTNGYVDSTHYGLWNSAYVYSTTIVDISSGTNLAVISPIILTDDTVSISVSSDSTNGYLDSTNFSVFTNKENVLTFSSPLSRAVNTVSIPVASSAVNGYLDSTSKKEYDSAYLYRLLSASGTTPLTLTLSTNVLSGSISQAGAAANGYLSSTDWNTFNDKQPLVVFSTGLTDTNDTVTVNTSQNITILSNLTTNGYMKTSGGIGTIEIDTTVYLSAETDPVWDAAKTGYFKKDTDDLDDITTGTTNVHLTSALKLQYDSAYLYRLLSASGTAPLTLTLSTNSLSGSMTIADDTTNGYIDSTHFTTWDAKQPLVVFSTGLTDTNDTVTINTSQNITTLSNLTNNGFVKTSGGDGTLGVDTAIYITGNQTITLSGDASGSGETTITVAVADNSHAHDSTTISNLIVGDFASQNISQWTNDSNYETVGHVHDSSSISNLIVADFASQNISQWTNDAAYISTWTDTMAVWGQVSGTLSNQTDIQSALDAKANTTHVHVNVSGTTYGSDSTITDAEFLYVNSVTSNVQNQINGKQGTLTNSDGLAAALSNEIGSGLVMFNVAPVVAGATADSTAMAINITDSAGVSMLCVRNDGNVGIGTTNPGYKLDVNGDINISTGSKYKINGTTLSKEDIPGLTSASSPVFTMVGWHNVITGQDWYIRVSDSSVLEIVDWTSSLTRLSITQPGSVGIGTTTPAAKLAVNGGCNIGADDDPGDNNLYVVDTCSALVFTDRTPFFEGDAIETLKNIKGKNGELDHSSLPNFLRADMKLKKSNGSEEIVEGRNLGNSISVLIKAVQEQQIIIETLQARIIKLESK